MSAAANMLTEKWSAVLNEGKAIASPERRAITATLLENAEAAIRSDTSGLNLTSLLSEAAPSTNTAGVMNYDPVLMTMIRRSMPNLMAYDVCGVQPMTMPTGLIFALRSRYGTQTGPEAFYNEADTTWSGTGTQTGATGDATITTGTGFDKTVGETLGTGAPSPEFKEMSFSIERVAVEAKTRALKAEYSHELAQDLRSVHSMDAEAELIKILTGEILADMNREVIRSIYISAVQGAEDTSTPGIFDLDVDANGRWSDEKYKGLINQIEKEANAIAKATRRGKGNIVIASSDVVSALRATSYLSNSPNLNTQDLQVDDTGNTFAGVLNGWFKVYVDPYAGANYMIVGYKGTSAFDAGLFYCPYVPLQLYRAVGENSFVPKIGFKSRAGLVMNPMQGLTPSNGAITANTNVWYRRIRVVNL